MSWSQWYCHVVLLVLSFKKRHSILHSDPRFQSYVIFNVHLLLPVNVLVRHGRRGGRGQCILWVRNILKTSITMEPLVCKKMFVAFFNPETKLGKMKLSLTSYFSRQHTCRGARGRAWCWSSPRGRQFHTNRPHLSRFIVFPTIQTNLFLSF